MRDSQAVAHEIVAQVEDRVQRGPEESRLGDEDLNALFFAPTRETPAVIARRLVRSLLSIARIA